MKLVVFTDLDGTLLDARDYSFAPAGEAVGLLKEEGIPLVVCTSKTTAEILYWRERLGNSHPFISENGGAVYMPAGYFPFVPEGSREEGGYHVTGFGTPYGRLREAVSRLREKGFAIRGFGDMDDGEVATLTGLTLEQSALARKREYDEPFVMADGGGAPEGLLAAIGSLGLKYTRGRLMHILGDNDKGRAVLYLAGLYARVYGSVVTAAIGDGMNDAPMLAIVDYPFLVRKPDGSHERMINDPRVVRVDGVGPEGWADAVMGLVKTTGPHGN
jgi:mannosyl-3-phosphoglycerate phosphatase